MNKTFNNKALLATFPEALKTSEDVYALAVLAANASENLYNDNTLIAIYTRIDELDEELLDILADDLKIDWYLQNGSIYSKRAQIKSSFFIRRRLGTKAAMLQALIDVCPGTEIKEWFEYGGAPHHFSVVIDMTNLKAPINYSVVKRLIDIFKPLRSVLDDVQTIHKSQVNLVIGNTVSIFKNLTIGPNLELTSEKYICDENNCILVNEEEKMLLL